MIQKLKEWIGYEQWDVETSLIYLYFALIAETFVAVWAAAIVGPSPVLVFIVLILIGCFTAFGHFLGSYVIPELNKVVSDEIPEVKDVITGQHRDQTAEEVQMYEDLTANIIRSVEEDFTKWTEGGTGMTSFTNHTLGLSIYPDISGDYDHHLRRAQVFDDTRNFRCFDGFTKNQGNRIAMAFYIANQERQNSKDKINRLYEKHRVTRLNRIMSRPKQ